MQCIDFGASGAVKAVDVASSTLVESPFFSLHRRTLSKGTQKLEQERPCVLIVVEGAGCVRTGDDWVPVNHGEVVLIPAAARAPHVEVDAGCAWLEVTFPS